MVWGTLGANLLGSLWTGKDTTKDVAGTTRTDKDF